MKKIALVDLDGSTADYDKAMRECLEKIKNPMEPDCDGPFMEERRKLIKNQPGFWRNLEPILLGFAVVDIFRKHGYLINILTKGPKKTHAAWSEKKEWCWQYFPSDDVHITENKGMVYGKILFDDWPEYITSWLEFRPRGFVFMLAQPWNVDFKHPQVFRVESEESLPEVECILQKL